jgi:mono/diheme cytochrome c family protein
MLPSLSPRAGAVFLLLCATIGPARADERAADVRRLLDLLTGVRIAYSEAFEDGEEELVAPVDLEEARLLLAEVRSLDARLTLLPAATLARVARELESPVGGMEVPALLDTMATDVTKQTGIARDRQPPAPPSSDRGRDLFGPNCAGCHGPRGAGDGPDAKRANITPADFTNVVFMRRETPADFFDRITLGHRRRGMPEWSALTALQRWDLVAYVWTLQQSDADRREGATSWTARCAGCHGPTGGGVAGAAPDLTHARDLVERTDRALFVSLTRGKHASLATSVSDAQRWRLVGTVRSLTLGGGSHDGAPPPHGAARLDGE